MTDDSSRQNPTPTGTPTSSSPAPSAVRLDKEPGAAGPQTQAGGASPWAEAQSAATSASNAARDAFQSGVSSFQSQSDVAQKKLVAGLLGIFLGSLGVHKFYLGNNQPAIIMLVCTLGGWVLGIVGSFIIVGAIFFVVPWVIGIVGLVEGIIYLTKSDADFQREYMVGKKPWF